MELRAPGRAAPGRAVALTALTGFAAVTLAACSTSGTPAASNKGPAASPMVVAVDVAQFGKILENDGKPLYTLAPSSTPCDPACTKIWPEFVLPTGVATAAAGAGVSASNLGTVNRGGGVLQVTYAGQPLYFFAQDQPGQVTGNITDVWGKWSDVVIASPAAAVATTTTTVAPKATPPAGTQSTVTQPPAPTTQPPPPTTQPPAPTTTTTASGGGGGVGF